MSVEPVTRGLLALTGSGSLERVPSGEILCNVVGAIFLLPLGLALGSFLELVADRLPRGESILWPPSHCRVCSHRLGPDELIPVISYLTQHGRCAACDTPIDRGVPVREALSGLALAVPWALVGCVAPAPALVGGVALLLVGWAVFGVSTIARPRPR
jgi:leader peptidase (prepilin peptidase) / N-methyltransferase